MEVENVLGEASMLEIDWWTETSPTCPRTFALWTLSFAQPLLIHQLRASNLFSKAIIHILNITGKPLNTASGFRDHKKNLDGDNLQQMASGCSEMKGNENPFFDLAPLDQEATNGEELRIIQKIKVMVEKRTFAWLTHPEYNLS